MLSSLLSKTINIYTAPARFAYQAALNQIDKARAFSDQIQQFKNDLALAEEEVNATIDKLINQVAQDLDQNSFIDERAREAAIVESLNRAEDLLSEASVELVKSLFLLLNPSSTALSERKKPRLSGNTIDGEFIRN